MGMINGALHQNSFLDGKIASEYFVERVAGLRTHINDTEKDRIAVKP